MGAKDQAEKHLLGHNEVFADGWNGLVLEEGDEKILPNELIDVTVRSQIVSDELKETTEQERDVAKIWVRGGLRVAFLGFENQSAVEKYMALRIMGYDGAQYKAEYDYVQDIKAALAKERRKTPRDTNLIAQLEMALRDFKPYPAITVVLYYGKKPWNKPTTLLECVGEETLSKIPKSLRSYVNDYKFKVIDVGRLRPEQIAKLNSDLRVVIDMAYQLNTTGRYKPIDHKIVHVRDTANAIRALFGSDILAKTYDMLPEREQKEGINMKKFYQKALAGSFEHARENLLEETKTKSLAEGKAEGVAEANAEAAVKLAATCFEFGADVATAIEKVMQKFGLSKEKAEAAVAEAQKQL